MQRHDPTRRAGRGRLTDADGVGHGAGRPTGRVKRATAPATLGGGPGRSERNGSHSAGARLDVAAVARALWRVGEHRGAAYERALRALPVSWKPALAPDLAALDLADEAVAFGARIGWAFATLPAPASTAAAETRAAWLEAVRRLAESPAALPDAGCAPRAVAAEAHAPLSEGTPPGAWRARR
jgi:hypothetical protein